MIEPKTETEAEARENSMIEFLREVASRTAPGSRGADEFTHVTSRVRLGRLLGADEAEIRNVLRDVDPGVLAQAIKAADIMGDPPAGRWCGACRCYTTQRPRRMSCYQHVFDPK